MTEPTDDQLDALRAVVAAQLRDVIDEAVPPTVDRAGGLERVLETARTRRRRAIRVAVPAALVAASLVALVLARAPSPSPMHGADVVRISFAEADDPSSVLTIDLVIHDVE